MAANSIGRGLVDANVQRFKSAANSRSFAAGWTWGYCSAVTQGDWRWIVDAYREDGKRYIVKSDELLTAFLELEATLL